MMNPWKCLGPTVGRRSFMQVGAVGALGLTLGDYFKLQAAEAAAPVPAKKGPKAESIIHIFLPGGMAHQESWDPKPFAPVEYRGDMGLVSTKIEGVQFSECMKQMATVADKVTVVRSMTHGEAAHERGTHKSSPATGPARR